MRTDSQDSRRVVITGMGVVSALGLDIDTFWDAARTGTCGIRPIEALHDE